MGKKSKSTDKSQCRKRINLRKKRLSSEDKVKIYSVLRNILLKSKYKNASASMQFTEANLKYTLAIEKTDQCILIIKN
jgi:hypothetical protein